MSHKNNYVCLSDLHLGARYSILSSRDNDGHFNVNQSSECLVELAAGLRDYIPSVFEDEPPKLVLLGDLVDYDFASLTDIVRALDVLLEVLFSGNTPLFQREIILVPGNHDHRLWEHEKDKLFLERFQEKDDDEQIPYHTSSLFRSSSFQSHFLNQLPTVTRLGISFEIRYPNWGLLDGGINQSNQKQVIFHHGHYVEPLYRLMTVINQWMSDIAEPDIEELERQNGGWIDFFWSSLGASPEQRDNVVLLHDIMQNPAATQQYSKRLAQAITNYLSTHYGVSPSTPVHRSITLEKMIATALHSTIGQSFQAERASIHHELSEAGWDGLQWYLSTPLHRQIASELNLPEDSMVDTDTTFIFGHTHKPFQEALGVKGYSKPVKVLNSGGWVVDEPEFSSVQGGAAVFVDDELNSASLRLFQAPVNGQMPAVCAEGVYHHEANTNPLLKRMQAALRPQQWQAFQQTVHSAIDLRAKEARARFFDPNSSTGVK